MLETEYRIIERYNPFEDKCYFFLQHKIYRKRFLRKPIEEWRECGIRGVYGELIRGVKTNDWSRVLNWRIKYSADVYAENPVSGNIELIYGTISGHTGYGVFICREDLPKP